MTDKRRRGETADSEAADSGGKAGGIEPPSSKAPPKSRKAAVRKAGPRKAGPRKDEERPPSDRPSQGLPAFGFAEELLGGKKPSEDDPERIFAFADRLASETREVEAETAQVRLSTWVTFHLAGEIFALPVEPVREVLRVASITRVPHAPDPIRGVTNVRGRVIPVIDLRRRIGGQAVDLSRGSRVIVVRSRGRRLGLLVDAVHQVVHVDLNLVQPPPEDVMTVQSDYITGVYHLGEQLVLMLDVDRALVVQGPDHLPVGATEASGSPGPSASAAT